MPLDVRVLHRLFVEPISLEFGQAGQVDGNEVLEHDQLLAAGETFLHKMNRSLVETWQMVLAHHGKDLPEVSFALHVLVQVRRAHLHDLLDRVR